MFSPVAELESGLQSMLQLKPPGVTGSRIASLTKLCTDNVQSESVLVQKLYTHFRKAPGTHKLGVLYVVDSVTRKWTEQARNNGQQINSASAEDGSFAAGVIRVTELLPTLMNDITQSAPEDQKEKIKKLVDIWEKAATFPLVMLEPIKEKLNGKSPNLTTTPPGSPPPAVLQHLGIPQPHVPGQAPASNPQTSSILAALANMARNQPNAAQSHPNAQNQSSLFNASVGQSNAAPQPQPMHQHRMSMPPVNVPAPSAFAQQALPAQNFAPSNPLQFAGVPPIVPPAGLDPAIQKQLLMIKALTDQGVPAEQIPNLLAILSAGQQVPGAGVAAPPLPSFIQSQNQNAQNSWGARQEESRDHHNGNGHIRSPDHTRRRSRSQSPPRGWNTRDSPPNRRRDGFDHEMRDFPDRGRGGDDRGRGGRGQANYRQRSPQRRRSPSPPRQNGAGAFVGHDGSIGDDNIKVLSRTLFVGGVTCSEYELRSMFARHGQVQTCIVNQEKRHAFVKMCSRQDAIAAKDAMEKERRPDSALRTRWGVGFGPRECSDYQTGISIIPISKLTEADCKWMLTAEFGGSGGQPIESGMVVEEPDIEIGQGVSSKAISRRKPTDGSGINGPKSGRRFDADEEQPRKYQRGPEEERRDRRRDDDRNDRHVKTEPGSKTMPPVPSFTMAGFPFQMPSLPHGMPLPPPGFPGFLANGQIQPPPPGQSQTTSKRFTARND